MPLLHEAFSFPSLPLMPPKTKDERCPLPMVERAKAESERESERDSASQRLEMGPYREKKEED